ncbi:MAG: helix-turn-helix domain-containing protein [Pseudomonadota bacterium]
MSLTEAAAGFAAIGSEARMLVLRSLVRAGETGRTVGEVQSATGIPASTLAHHLRFLTAAGLVIQERRGRSTINRAAYAHLNALAIFILDECCSEVAGEAIEGRIKP